MAGQLLFSSPGRRDPWFVLDSCRRRNDMVASVSFELMNDYWQLMISRWSRCPLWQACFLRTAICRILVFLRKSPCQDGATFAGETTWSHAEAQRAQRFRLLLAFLASWRESIWLRPQAALRDSRHPLLPPVAFICGCEPGCGAKEPSSSRRQTSWLDTPLRRNIATIPRYAGGHK